MMKHIHYHTTVILSVVLCYNVYSKKRKRKKDGPATTNIHTHCSRVQQCVFMVAGPSRFDEQIGTGTNESSLFCFLNMCPAITGAEGGSKNRPFSRPKKKSCACYTCVHTCTHARTHARTHTQTIKVILIFSCTCVYSTRQSLQQSCNQH